MRLNFIVFYYTYIKNANYIYQSKSKEDPRDDRPECYNPGGTWG